MKKLFLFLLLLNGISEPVVTQEVYNHETKGNRYYFGYSYYKAIYQYKKVKHLSVPAQRKLADSYHHTDQPLLAEKVFLGIIKSAKEVQPEDYFNAYMACKTNGKYAEADKWMQLFVQSKPNDLRALDYLANKSKLQDLAKNSNEYAIHHLAMNTDALDFGTSFYKNKIVFSSSRSNTMTSSKKYNWTQKPFWNMYVADTSKGELATPILFDQSLGSKWNDGPASFTHDGNFMAFTRNHLRDKGKDGIVELQIFFSTRQNGQWSTPVPFILNDPAYSVGQPCLTVDGEMMFFTSDMPGGYGKADIYSVRKNEKGEWGAAKNLGNIVNTEGDEMFPFITENQETLYFASDGHFGLGGLDIFSYPLKQGVVAKVQNTGAPVNTQYNDYGFILHETSGNGYFSSDRKGGRGGDDVYAVNMLDPAVTFSVSAPANRPFQRSIRESFPLRNYIFFDKNETNIANRYVLLTKNQVAQFSEEKLTDYSDTALANRSNRQLQVYYHILNILGARMQKNPQATLTLVGSSENGADDGSEMASSVKTYLTDIFDINGGRIFLEGRNKPKIPSEQPGGKLELTLLQEGDRRVSVESNFPGMLQVIETGAAIAWQSPPQPAVTATAVKYPVFFTATGAKNAFTEWSLEIKDRVEVVQKFGPFTDEQVVLAGRSILGPVLREGRFTATMIGQTKNGRTLQKEATVNLDLPAAAANEELMRFSVIFEFNDSASILIYHTFLTEVLVPKIPVGAMVKLYGHTDIIGGEIHNTTLSLDRMRTVRSIIENSLQKTGRRDVQFEEHWYGEGEAASPFANRLPEERFYNRTVIIDIIPKQ